MISKLPILLIEAHSRCNCRCTMCDIWKTSDSRDFTAAQLESQMETILGLGVERVVFTGGEPLMHSDLFRLCARLRGQGIQVTLLTTGLLLERYAAQVDEHISDVIVSLDGPEQIHDRIRRVPGAFRMLASGAGAVHVPAAARSTVQKANHAVLIETAAAAREIGLQSISFLAADLTSEAFNRPEPWSPQRQSEIALTAEECDRLEQQMDDLIANPFVIDSPAHLRRIVQLFRAHLGLAAFEAPRCNAPWVSAVLEPDGSVRPCFFHKRIGKTLAQGLNSSAAIEFRRSLDVASNEICRRCVCSLYKSVSDTSFPDFGPGLT